MATTLVPPAPAQRPGRRRPLTAFVLAGGASLGAMQAGMLAALYERGIAPDLVVATSAGGLNAAYIASRPQTPATAQDLARVWHGLRRDDIFPTSVRTLVNGLTGRGDHFVPDRGLRAVISRHLELAELEDAAVPLHLIAYDVLHGEPVRLSEGPAVEALLATTAIPGVLPAVPIGDRLLIDGGVVDNAPIGHAVALGAERIFVLPTMGFDAAPPRVARTAVDAAVNAFMLLMSGPLRADVLRYADAADIVVLPASNVRGIAPTDFSHSRWLVQDARAAAREHLAAVPLRDLAA